MAIMDGCDHPIIPGPSSTPLSRHVTDFMFDKPALPPSRRQSDSTLTRSDQRVDIEERAKLRQWAAEASAAPPPLLEPCEPSSLASSPRSATVPRRLRTRSKSPPRSMRFDVDLLQARRKSLFTASMGTSLPPLSTASLSPVSAPPSASSPIDARKGLAQRRNESGQLDGTLLDSVKSVTISNDGFVLPDKPPNLRSTSQHTARPRKTPTLLRTHIFSPATTPSRLSYCDDTLTPRASGCDSPHSNSSTGGSDDIAPMLTPSEEAGPSSSRSRLRPRVASSELVRTTSAGSGTPPVDTLTDEPADRIGSNRGLDALGEAADAGPIGAYLNVRRGSHSSLDSGSKADSPSPVPPLSRSTLVDVGAIEGLTPPPLLKNGTLGATSAAAGSKPHLEPTSVVSAGLEMGLGVSMATAALAATLPGGSSGLGNFAEPRYSRLSSVPIDARPMPSMPRELAMTSVSGTPSPQSSGLHHSTEDAGSALILSHSEKAPEDASLSSLSNTEAELSRRRTTGWDVGKARKTVGKRDRQRAGTRDVTFAPRPETSRPPAAVPPKEHVATGVISLIPHFRDGSDHHISGYSAGIDSGASSFDSRSTHARASRTASTQVDTPSLSGHAMLSPDVNPHVDTRGGLFGGRGNNDGIAEDERIKRAKEALLRDEANGGSASYGNNGGLMGSNVGGHFGPGIRAKVIEVLDPLIAAVPMTGQEGETLQLVEYGCLNSRSIPLMQLIVSKLVQRAHSRGPSLAAVAEENLSDGASSASNYGTPHEERGTARHVHIDGEPSRVNFTVLHEDNTQADFRPIIQSLDSRSDSYLDATWQATHNPPLQNAVFPSFVGRPFASRVAPPETFHFGLSLMDLHWTHTPQNPAISLATSAHAELATFLKARAAEFKTGGILVVAFLARSDDERSPSVQRRQKATSTIQPASQSHDNSPVNSLRQLDADQRERSSSTPPKPDLSGAYGGGKKSTDIWTTLTNSLAPCIQRLVSCGMLKSDVARHLLNLPLHPRTPRQTKSVLTSVRHLWNVEWSCGLGEGDKTGPSGSSPTSATASNAGTSGGGSANAPRRGSGPRGKLPSEPQPLRIAHPAWKAFQAGTLSKVALAEHMIMLFKNLYETHFRSVLREKGKLSKGAVEFVLDSLWDVLSSRIDDSHPSNPMEEVEIEVTICALRKVSGDRP